MMRSMAPTQLTGSIARIVRTNIVSKGDPISGSAFANAHGWADTAQVVKAQVGALDHATAEPLVQRSLEVFFEETDAQSVWGRIGVRPGIFDARLITGDVEPAVAWLGPDFSAPIPVVSADFASMSAMKRMTVAIITVISSELARASSQEATILLDRLLKRALVLGQDRAFLDPFNAGVPNARPASISWGQPQFVSTGTSVAALDTDLQTLVDSLVTHGVAMTPPTWIMDRATATRLALKRSAGALAYPGMSFAGGTLVGLPVVISAALEPQASPNGHTLLLVDGDCVEVATDDDGTIEVSHQASVQMNSTPSGGPQPLESLWQRNWSSVRITRSANWRVSKFGAVASLSGITF